MLKSDTTGTTLPFPSGSAPKAKVMDNRAVQAFFGDAYNSFFVKWRNKVPDLHDKDAWSTMLDEANAVLHKYEQYEDASHAPLTSIMGAMCDILDYRARVAKGVQ